MAAMNLPKMTNEELCAEINRGARFVQFDYNISFVVLTLTLRSPIYYVPPGESSAQLGLRYTLLTFFFGWWAIPYGPIRSCITLFINLRGGRDLTDMVLENSPLGDILWGPRGGPAPDEPQTAEQATSLAQVREHFPEGRRAGVPTPGNPTPGAPAGGEAPTRVRPRPAVEPLPTSVLAIISVCLGVSALLVPCFYWSGVVGAMAILAGLLALKATGGPKPERSGRHIAYAGIGSAVAGIVVSLLLFFLYSVISSDSFQDWSARNRRDGAFGTADRSIDSYGASAHHGNCEVAEDLAAAYGRMIEAEAPLAVPPYQDTDFAATPFLVYCHLTDDVCLFMVRAPKLQDIQGADLDRLNALAWQTGSRVIAGEEQLRLIIATRGDSAVYQSKLYGDAQEETPQVAPAKNDKVLKPLFRTDKPTRSFTFDLLQPDTGADDGAAPVSTPVEDASDLP